MHHFEGIDCGNGYVKECIKTQTVATMAEKTIAFTPVFNKPSIFARPSSSCPSRGCCCTNQGRNVMVAKNVGRKTMRNPMSFVFAFALMLGLKKEVVVSFPAVFSPPPTTTLGAARGPLTNSMSFGVQSLVRGTAVVAFCMVQCKRDVGGCVCFPFVSVLENKPLTVHCKIYVQRHAFLNSTRVKPLFPPFSAQPLFRTMHF